MPGRWVRSFGWGFAVLTILFPFCFFLRRRLIQPIDSIVFLGLMSWLAILFYLVCLRGIFEVIPLAVFLYSKIRKKTAFDPARRQFLLRTLAVGTLTIGVAGVARGMMNTFKDPAWKDVPVRLDRLPPLARGFTIVQLTDLHVSPWTPLEFLERIVDRVNASRPDVVVITGDLVDGEVDRLGDKIGVFAKLSALHGVFFVTGNHEYYVETDPWLDQIRRMGITILHNSGLPVAGAIFLAGIPDRTIREISGVSPDDWPDIPRALANRPADLPTVLLAHQPREIAAAVSAGVDLQLSGHTHGGQIWPFGVVVMAAQPYISGLHRRDQTQIYVSRGTGTWGPPMRIAAPAELTRIVLT